MTTEPRATLITTNEKANALISPRGYRTVAQAKRKARWLVRRKHNEPMLMVPASMYRCVGDPLPKVREIPRTPPSTSLGCTPQSRARIARRAAKEAERIERERQETAQREAMRAAREAREGPSKGTLTLAAALALADMAGGAR